jgi:hypothetical protein
MKYLKHYNTFKLLEMKLNPIDYLNGGNPLGIKLFESEPEIVEIILKKITTLVDAGFIERKLDIYKPFDKAFQFSETLYRLFELSEKYLSHADRLKVFCDDRIKLICKLLCNTADNQVEELRRKYPIVMPTLDNMIGDAQNRYKLEACREFLKKYSHLPDVVFNDAANLAASQLDLTVEEIWKIRMIDFGLILKYGGVPGTPEWINKVKSSWDPKKVEKDPLYTVAQKIYKVTHYITDWQYKNCDDDVWKFDDDDTFQTPTINFNNITFTPPNIKVNIEGGSGDNRKGDIYSPKTT